MKGRYTRSYARTFAHVAVPQFFLFKYWPGCLRGVGLIALFGAVPAQAAQVTLTWSDSAGDQTGFVIERSTDGQTFSQVATAGASDTSYVDQTVSASTQYWYQIYATNSAGSSDGSNIAEVTAVTGPDGTTAAPPASGSTNTAAPPPSTGTTSSTPTQVASAPPTQTASGNPSQLVASLPFISSARTASATTGTSFIYTIQASNSPASYSLSGSLPTGLSFDSSGGTISGVPTEAGAFTLTLGASNAAGVDTQTLTLTVSAAPSSRLVNISARAVCGAGNQDLIVGFVINGGSKSILLRGLGPSLGSFGVGGYLGDPELNLFEGSTVVGSDAGWTDSPALTAAFAAAGAFSLPAGSADSALLLNLPAGSYTSQVSSPDGSSGVALGELYDADTSVSPAGRLSNFSARAEVGTSANVLVAGFVIEGNAPKQVLIRASGPSLAQFGVSGVLAQPAIDLYQEGQVIGHNNGWGSSQDLSAAFAQVGAFAFSSPLDSALLVTLQPGSYTAQVSGADGGGGVALIEVYEML